MALAAEAQPDVVVLDLYMPDMSGIRMLAELRERMPEVKVLMVTASEKAHTLLDAVAAEASGYLTKRVSSRELCEAVLTVAGGGSVITPALAGHLLREYSRRRGETPLAPAWRSRRASRGCSPSSPRAGPTARSRRRCTCRPARSRTT
jgi:DNA-binding NarL/FixJ family response regulator